MSNYSITNIKPFDKFESNETYLALIAIDKTPPHLALFSNLKYFSLSSNGVKKGVDANIILNSLNRKSIQCLFLLLSEKLDLKQVSLEFNKYSHLKKGQSCLNPIKNLLTSSDNNLGNYHYAFDLIPAMYSRNLISDAYKFNYVNSNFEFIQYSQEEIDLAIYNAAQLC